MGSLVSYTIQRIRGSSCSPNHMLRGNRCGWQGARTPKRVRSFPFEIRQSSRVVAPKGPQELKKTMSCTNCLGGGSP